jgi:signal transduction histidine kinase
MVSLRWKIARIIIASVFLYAVLIFSIQHFYVRPSFVALEHEVAEKELLRIVDALQDELSSVEEVCTEWAERAATDDYLGESNRQRPPMNPTSAEFLEHRLNLIYLIDASGKVIHGNIHDLEAGRPVHLDEFPTTRWAKTHPLLVKNNASKMTKGVFMTKRGPLLLAGHTIPGKSDNEAVAGTIFMGRFLSEDIISNLQSQTYDHLSIWLPNSALPADAEVAWQTLSPKKPVYFRSKSNRLLQVYTHVQDVFGRPALLLQLNVNRTLLAYGQNAMRLGSLAALAAGLFIMLMLMVLMRRMVLTPLGALTRHVTHISHEDELTPFPDDLPNDEIGILGREFNKMIRRLNRDITKTKDMQEQLFRAKHLATIGEMGASVAHEIRNPLAGISGAVQVLLDKHPADDPHKPILEKVLDQVNRVEATVRQLLDYSREWNITPGPNRLLDLARDVVAEAEGQDTFKHIHFAFSGDTDLAASVDADLLKQVLWNLFSNAAQAMDQGGTVEIAAYKVEKVCCLEVKDSGGGISDENMKKLFQPFFTTKVYGTGLGLAICRRIVEAHGGTITINSTPGEGAQVLLQFPEGEKL